MRLFIELFIEIIHRKHWRCPILTKLPAGEDRLPHCCGDSPAGRVDRQLLVAVAALYRTALELQGNRGSVPFKVADFNRAVVCRAPTYTTLSSDPASHGVVTGLGLG